MLLLHLLCLPPYHCIYQIRICIGNYHLTPSPVTLPPNVTDEIRKAIFWQLEIKKKVLKMAQSLQQPKLPLDTIAHWHTKSDTLENSPKSLDDTEFHEKLDHILASMDGQWTLDDLEWLEWPYDDLQETLVDPETTIVDDCSIKFLVTPCDTHVPLESLKMASHKPNIPIIAFRFMNYMHWTNHFQSQPSNQYLSNTSTSHPEYERRTDSQSKNICTGIISNVPIRLTTVQFSPGLGYFFWTPNRTLRFGPASSWTWVHQVHLQIIVN